MIEFIKNLLISITCVSIFCTVILHFIGSDNSQREIVKIGCGCLMIITIISPFISTNVLENLEFTNLYEQYSIITDNTSNNLDSYTINVVEAEIENLILDEFNVDSDVKLSENYEIISVIVYDNKNIDKISQFLSINVDKIEYIESR